MEMKDIDLTKCVNCRFRAEISNTEPVSGRIVVDKSKVYLMDKNGNYIGLLSLDGEELMWFNGCGFTDFEIVPRDPETYRDWQVGDTIESSDNYSTGRIIFRGGDFVAADIEGTCNCYTCDELFNEGYRLVLTDIEQQIIEDKKKYEPQDGDICFVRTAAGNCFSFIKRDGDEYGLDNYDYACADINNSCLCPAKYVCRKEDISELRPATKDEKQMLFDAMAKDGKRWNAEKKVVEDIPKPYEFRKGEPVLVRDNDENIWILSSFIQFIPTSCFLVTNGVRPSHWKQCIPYNKKTMHLLGTAEDYKEDL